MLLENSMFKFYFSPALLIITGTLVSFIITFFGIPSVIKVARIKCLYDIPGSRTSHLEPTPRLGGSMVFAGVIISSVLFTGLGSAYELKYIIAGMIVLFFIGVKDDIISLNPMKKAIGQFLAAAIIVVAGDIRIDCCFGIFGHDSIGYILSASLSILIVMALINSINFIDGIDGLAAGTGSIASAFFGAWFFYHDQLSYAVICFSLTGSLIAFFYYNVFGKGNKIFLGDTGSMIIGFLLSVFVIRFLELNANSEVEAPLNSAPSLVLAVLFIPIFDALRIITVRLLHRKSIFLGDNNHLHHRVLRFAGTHLKATLIILAVNLFIIIMTFMLRSAGNNILIPSLIFIGICFSLVLGLKIPKQ